MTFEEWLLKRGPNSGFSSNEFSVMRLAWDAATKAENGRCVKILSNEVYEWCYSVEGSEAVQSCIRLISE